MPASQGPPRPTAPRSTARADAPRSATRADLVRALLAKKQPLVMGGFYDGVSARLVAKAGFPLAFMGGYAVAASLLGEPDIGLLGQAEMADAARRLCRLVPAPVLVDADTGYGGIPNVVRTAELYAQAGAAGLFLEDQVWPKRCGHMRNKKVIDREEYVDKIRAAVDARAGRDFFIVARTDALAIHGMDEAIARVTAAREAGANASFVEAPASLQDLIEIGKRSPWPNVANMIEGGKTPVLPKEQLVALGFQIILYPLAGLFSAAKIMEEIFRKLQLAGTTLGDEQRLMTFSEFNRLIGVEEKYDLAERFGVR